MVGNNPLFRSDRADVGYYSPHTSTDNPMSAERVSGFHSVVGCGSLRQRSILTGEQTQK